VAGAHCQPHRADSPAAATRDRGGQRARLRRGFGIALACDIRLAETLCGYGKFGLESTKQVLWANLEASSLEAALHVENRSQILASASGEMGAATEAFRHRQR
jgi:hypothetical protein